MNRKLSQFVVLLFLAAAMAAQKDPAPVLLPGQAAPVTGKQRVFLTPQKDTVILVLPPDQEGGSTAPAILRLPIHIHFEASLSARLQRKDDFINYQYEVQNGAASTDSINALWFVVSCEDKDIQLQSKDPKWVGTISTTPIALSAAGEDSWRGCYASWIGEDVDALAPGKEVNNLTLISKYLPGLTTAYIMHFPTIDIAGDLPEEVIPQLEPVAHPTWSSKHPISIGPRYALDTPKSTIAQDFLKGMKALVEQGILDRRSPAVRELFTVLANAGNLESSKTSLHSRPANSLERALLEAVSMSLGIPWEEDSSGLRKLP